MKTDIVTNTLLVTVLIVLVVLGWAVVYTSHQLQEVEKKTAEFHQERRSFLEEKHRDFEAEQDTAIQGLLQQIDQLEDQLYRSEGDQEELEKRLEETEQKLDELLSQAPEGFEVAGVMYDFQVTWYNYNSGYTFTGVPPEQGITVAVDPDVIDLNTWIKIVMPDGTEYVRKAQDTGGAVKGKIVDIYSTASTSELMVRGRTHGVRVYLLNERAG